MPATHEELYDILNDNFPESEIEIEDLRGDDNHYSVKINSAIFAGKSRIEQHRIVQNAVEKLDIHALAIKTTH